MPKAKISAKDASHAKHNAFLRRLGIDPTKRPRLCGAQPDVLSAKPHVRRPEAPATSDSIPGNGTRRDMQVEVHAGRETAATAAKTAAYGLRVAQLYPKGPYGLVSDPDHLKSNVRRPPT